MAKYVNILVNTTLYSDKKQKHEVSGWQESQEKGVARDIIMLLCGETIRNGFLSQMIKVNFS